MTDYILCETREDAGAVVHVVTWTMDTTIGKAKMHQKVYHSAFHGADSAIKDAAERLGVTVGQTIYGLNGFSNAKVE